MIFASCACGAVTFASQAEPVAHGYCHCADCRQATGRAFSEIAFFSVSGSTIDGAVDRVTFELAGGVRTHRERCAACNTVMFDRSDRFSGLVGVMVKQIKSPLRSRPGFHMWTASRQADVAIDDALPHFSGRPSPTSISS